MLVQRRQMLAGCAVAIGCSNDWWMKLGLSADTRSNDDLRGLIGVTTGSFQRNFSPTPEAAKLCLLDLPKIMRDELGMRVLDVMTASFPSMEPDYLDEFRSRSEKAGCILTNLKMNQPGIDIGSENKDERNRAIAIYQKSIDAAEQLGCRWVRPLPLSELPSWDRYLESYRRLIDYAAPKGISLLVENYGWMKDKPDAIPSLIKAVGPGLAAAPDIGNWTNEARYDALTKAFPLAVTCDFKAFAFDEKGEHSAYDLKRCFQIGWDVGYRGPWCFEHFHSSLPTLFKEMIRLREMIERWTKESTT
ncbi:MAG: TIM barrel protein [Pirellulaceae bacterium]|nr:TIM barrel protein [Pirellulaceae bacterium]